jgi:hypothetical protein
MSLYQLYCSISASLGQQSMLQPHVPKLVLQIGSVNIQARIINRNKANPLELFMLRPLYYNSQFIRPLI